MNTTPPWLKKRIAVNSHFFETKKAISESSVNTVCESAVCPNTSECFSRGFATFMILGKACTRSCAFCSVEKGETAPIDTEEPRRIADCVNRLGLKYVVVTSVTRDDLADGGAGQFVRVVETVKRAAKDAIIELLIPDFAGMKSSIETIAGSDADIIGHNIETVERLYPIVREGADYSGSLDILRAVKEMRPKQLTKSAILVGMGETKEEVIEAMEDLRSAGCGILTIGQYLRPSKRNHPVERFVTPGEFDIYKKEGGRLGFRHVSAGPFVRSSYLAEECYEKCHTAAVS